MRACGVPILLANREGVLDALRHHSDLMRRVEKALATSDADMLETLLEAGAQRSRQALNS